MTDDFTPHLTPEIWTDGQRLHTRLDKCALCGSPDGHMIFHAQVVVSPAQTALLLTGIGSALCPNCKAKHLPLSKVMSRRLDKRGEQAWQQLKKLGCHAARQASTGTPIALGLLLRD
jgi:hypothetical protein